MAQTSGSVHQWLRAHDYTGRHRTSPAGQRAGGLCFKTEGDYFQMLKEALEEHEAKQNRL